MGAAGQMGLANWAGQIGRPSAPKPNRSTKRAWPTAGAVTELIPRAPAHGALTTAAPRRLLSFNDDCSPAPAGGAGERACAAAAVPLLLLNAGKADPLALERHFGR